MAITHALGHTISIIRAITIIHWHYARCIIITIIT